MRAITAKKVFMVVLAVFSLSSMGCTRILGIEKSSAARNGDYYPTCLVRADQALDEARMAGKDKQCPDEFKAIKDKVDLAYKVHLGCNTDGACKMSREAIAQVRALTCPEKPAAVEPPPAPVPEPVPMPVPVPPAPSDNLTVAPSSITKGQSATLTWSSTNATNCEIQPEIGAVQPQGSMTITPTENAAYTLTCSGAGGTAKSAANLSVIIPPPPAPAPKLCSPTVIDIHFDTNKSDIKPRYHDELKKLGDFLSEFPKASGVIEGHTDNVGHTEANMKLSQRRAESVRSYLIEKFGIAPERIKAVGYGPTKPIASNNTKAGKEQNRRIEANFTCNAN
jgi:OmpA-OmpF porin, OOP family